MRSVLPLLVLSSTATCLPPALTEPAANRIIHNVMEDIESGMEDPVEGEGRAFWLGLTLTSTTTILNTATVTDTVSPSCVLGSFTACTEMPESKTRKHKRKKAQRARQLAPLDDDVYRDAVVTDEFGEERELSVLLPVEAGTTEAKMEDTDVSCAHCEAVNDNC